MHVVTKRFETDTAHRLQHHPGLCRNLHGHRYAFEVTLRYGVGQALGVSGMVVDFGEIKRTIGAWIAETFDHALVLEHNDPIVEALGDSELRVLCFPRAPTAEAFAEFVYDGANRLLAGTQAKVIHVRCYETPTGWADYSAE